ncbi:hypothetical protein H0H81_007017 [Sphagnurus paluster]|uniref:Uncharacterized protein n=1 Tax=Sphagnurus paluster TaxID=117069 RepID=A0A9P7K6P3_9AGAR|nr:hypothetical protein H0H81_007017 [Sphagnurus paluster]
MLTIGALEVGMVFAIRPSMNRRAIEFFGIFTSVVIAAGLLPQYWEIIERKEVVGISLPFITIDLLGAVFSLLSLIFRPKFDTIAGVAYIVVIVMDSIVVTAAFILNPRAHKRRQREVDSTLTTETREMTATVTESPDSLALHSTTHEGYDTRRGSCESKRH